MSGLNPEQQQIVEHLDGPALVIAGAGSGKTRVITTRVAHLIRRGIPPAAILMVTFTNKAAEEMQRRVEGLVGEGGLADKLISGTFHSVANRFLRRYAPLIGYQHNFSILDVSDSRDLIKAAMAEVWGKGDERPEQAPGVRLPTATVVQNVLSMAFNRSLELPALLQREYPWLEEVGHELSLIQQAYRRKKKANNAMDFDDLLEHWHALLTEHANLELARQIRYAMVDEYQDTNLVQAQILEALMGPGGNLMVVGDDAQSIYGWRGANFENILHFPTRFGGTIYRLEENYRSSPEILALANSSINHNVSQFEKHLRAMRPALEKPRVTHLYDQYDEADGIVERIRHYTDRDIPLGEMGVLYRNHMQSAVLQMRLTERGIPFVVRSGIKFFEQAHIKDAVAFLKVVFNPLDEIAWLRVLKLLPGIGNTTAHKIYRLFQDQKAVRLSPDNLALAKAIPAKARPAWQTFAATLKDLLRENITPQDMLEAVRKGFYHDVLYAVFDNAAERDADLAYLAEFAAKYRSLERFLGQLALVGSTVIQDDSAEEERPEHLTLTTIHQAKGLEWDVVFVIGLADGKFPHARCLEPLERLEEERRLFYVAVTRCKRHLELSVPLVNMINGGNPEICRPSRFVEELPEHVVEVIRADNVEELRPSLGPRTRMTVEL
jgi:DNA helicase-2/ATP-dependent DNA helicase PcrA